MIFTFNDIVSHYKSKPYPCIKQQDLIANKYKELFGSDITPSSEVYLLLNVATQFRPADRHLNMDNSTEMSMEKQAFDYRFSQLKKLRSFLKKLGIDKKSYIMTYDYDNMVIACNHKKKGDMVINFQFPRTYLVLFEKEHYNFVRLAYEYRESNDPVDYLDLIFDFQLTFIDDFD